MLLNKYDRFLLAEGRGKGSTMGEDLSLFQVTDNGNLNHLSRTSMVSFQVTGFCREITHYVYKVFSFQNSDVIPPARATSDNIKCCTVPLPRGALRSRVFDRIFPVGFLFHLYSWWKWMFGVSSMSSSLEERLLLIGIHIKIISVSDK